MANAPTTAPLELPVKVAVTVMTVRDDGLSVLLAPVGDRPELARLVFPAGPPGGGEDLDGKAQRVLREEAAAVRDPPHLEQLAAYADRRRDGRGRIIRIVYLAAVPSDWVLSSRYAWHGLTDLGMRSLDFDRRILEDATDRIRDRIENTPVATAFCPAEFTVAELRQVYEVVWGSLVDPRNFHRKVTGAQGFLRPTGRKTPRAGGRPAELYRRGNATTLWPAVTPPPW